MRDFTAIIASIFDPPTLAPLVAQLKSEGAVVNVVRGMRVNRAWNTGVAQAKTRYAAILNDDIVLSHDAVDRLLRHHADGYSYVSVIMWRELQTQGKGSRYLGQPAHKGHAFSMDLSLGVPPIPDDLEIYFGDDWFYWQHCYHGRCCAALDVTAKTGFDIGYEKMSGFSCHHPDIDMFLGERLYDVAIRDHVAARKYFVFPLEKRSAAERIHAHGFAEAVRPAQGLLA